MSVQSLVMIGQVLGKWSRFVSSIAVFKGACLHLVCNLAQLHIEQRAVQGQFLGYFPKTYPIITKLCTLIFMHIRSLFAEGIVILMNGAV